MNVVTNCVGWHRTHKNANVTIIHCEIIKIHKVEHLNNNRIVHSQLEFVPIYKMVKIEQNKWTTIDEKTGKENNLHMNTNTILEWDMGRGWGRMREGVGREGLGEDRRSMMSRRDHSSSCTSSISSFFLIIFFLLHLLEEISNVDVRTHIILPVIYILFVSHRISLSCSHSTKSVYLEKKRRGNSLEFLGKPLVLPKILDECSKLLLLPLSELKRGTSSMRNKGGGGRGRGE